MTIFNIVYRDCFAMPVRTNERPKKRLILAFFIIGDDDIPVCLNAEAEYHDKT